MASKPPYNPHSMNPDELASKKYCHQCKEIQETYWELTHCDKNPEGIDVFVGNHGNDDTCEDDYCHPESTQIEKEHITTSYIKEHAVYERCVQCHQYFDSAGPQAKQIHPEQCNNCDGTGIFETCTECGGPGCVYCNLEDGDNIIPGKDCVMCQGTGKIITSQKQEMLKVQKNSLCVIGDDWDNIHRNTKVYLPEDSWFPTFHGKTVFLKSGNYFIAGFWASIVGLSDTQRQAMKGDAKYHISSVNLREFWRGKKHV